REHDRQVLALGQTQTWGQPEGAPAGERQYVSRKTPFRDGRGNMVGLISICREVTEEERLRTELAEATAAMELEVQARQRAEEAVREWQAQQRAGEEQAAELARAASLLQQETVARQRAEESLRAVEARLQAADTP